MKKIIATLLAIAIFATSIYVGFLDKTEVEAAETSVTSDMNLDMIKIKMQASRTPYTYNDQRALKLRIVASVDSLDYSAVGFKVWYNEDITNGPNGGLNEKPTVTHRTGTVYERIVAANDGVAYEYSPKVVDTSSEYFVTATLVNIAEKNWDKNFYIKAYYITLDGQTVEGEGRFFNINEANSNEMINIPIEMTKEQYDNMTTLTFAGETYQIGNGAEKAYYDGKCGHVYINVGDKTELKSVSLIQAGTGVDAPSTIYRNLNSKYTVDNNNNTTGDITWYDVYLQKYPEQTEFVIANEADLYGLASKYTTNTGSAMDIFKGKTFYLIKDMEMNEVVDGEFQTQTIWKGIGKYIPSHVINFAGNFDGQGHTISGIYRYHDANAHATEVSNKGVYAGFFNRTQAGVEIKNFTLENSHFEGLNAANEYLGAITGYDAGGSYENISVKETVSVKGTGKNAGGFVGSVAATATQISFRTCEFKGTVSAAEQVGGFVGSAPLSGKKIYFENCFVGGTVEATAANMAAGFCGSVSTPKVYVENCMSVATVKRPDNATIGFIGSAGGGSITYNNAYTTAASRTAVHPTNKTKITATKRGNTSIKSNYAASAFKGENAFINTALNFQDVWTVVDADYPQLRLFTDVVQDEPQKNRLHLTSGDTSWLELYDGTQANPYILKDAEDLYGLAALSKGTDIDGEAFADKLFDGKYFVVANDITVNYDNDTDTNRLAWPGVGGQDSNSAFKGNFNGNGHTISGIYYNSTSATNMGFFKCTAKSSTGNTTIENFNLTNTKICAVQQVGAVAGVMYSGIYRDVHVLNDVNVEGTKIIGGVAGRILPQADVSIENCSFEGNVKATNTVTDVTKDEAGGYAGGICGWVYRNGTPGKVVLNNCVVDGDITSTSIWNGGYFGYITTNSVDFLNCIFTGTVTSTADENGGFIGSTKGSYGSYRIAMEQCQFDGTVTSTGRKLGGFIGAMDTDEKDASNIIMNNCLSSGTIDASACTNDAACIGGFVGWIPQYSRLTVKESLSVASLVHRETQANYGPIVGLDAVGDAVVSYKTYATSLGKETQLVEGSFEVVDADDIRGNNATTNMPELDFENTWICQKANEFPVIRFNAESITVDDVTASAEEVAQLQSLYLDRELYQGEMHAHAKTLDKGDDGNIEIASWLTDMESLNLNFAASLDHHQISHFEHLQSNGKAILYGTEAGTKLTGLVNPNAKGEVHYNMLFPTQEGLDKIISEFGYKDSSKLSIIDLGFISSGKYEFGYPDFTKQEFTKLIQRVLNGDQDGNYKGFFVHAHPTQEDLSDPDTYLEDYYFTDYAGFEVFFIDTPHIDEKKETDEKYGTYGAYGTPESASHYKVWNNLLKSGKRLYATAGSDTHDGLNTYALTSVYSTAAAKDDIGTIITQLQEGDFTAGAVGIQMSIDNTKMGGHLVFNDTSRLVVNLGKFHFSNVVSADDQYCVNVITEDGIVYSQRLTFDENGVVPTNGTFALDVDATSKYYRVEVVNMTHRHRIALGNPIWNDASMNQ